MTITIDAHTLIAEMYRQSGKPPSHAAHDDTSHRCALQTRWHEGKLVSRTGHDIDTALCTCGHYLTDHWVDGAGRYQGCPISVCRCQRGVER